MTNTDLAETTAAGLRALCAELAEALGRKPNVAELFDLLTAGLQSADPALLADVRPDAVTALTASLERGAKARPLGDAMGDVGDGPYSAAAGFVARVARAHRDAAGAPPTLDEFRDLLLRGLHAAPDDLFGDVAPSRVTAVRAKARKQPKVAAQVGDVVAIPAAGGGVHRAVVLARDQFGVAYGPLGDDGATARGRPVYSDDALVGSGRWKVVGHDESLLALFPGEPEIYHRPMNVPGVPVTEPHGAAETASGALRLLTRDEAEAVGLTSGAYRQAHNGTALEQYLDRAGGRGAA
jgi:hypothetical protein